MVVGPRPRRARCGITRFEDRQQRECTVRWPRAIPGKFAGQSSTSSGNWALYAGDIFTSQRARRSSLGAQKILPTIKYHLEVGALLVSQWRCICTSYTAVISNPRDRPRFFWLTFSFGHFSPHTAFARGLHGAETAPRPGARVSLARVSSAT